MGRDTEESRARPGATDDQRGGRPCPLCDAPLFRRHCKYVCPQHGVVFDCADPFN